jgi:hypothetical protein
MAVVVPAMVMTAVVAPMLAPSIIIIGMARRRQSHERDRDDGTDPCRSLHKASISVGSIGCKLALHAAV